MKIKNYIIYQDNYNNLFLYTGKRNKRKGHYYNWHEIYVFSTMGEYKTYVKNKDNKKIKIASDRLIVKKLIAYSLFFALSEHPNTTKKEWRYWKEHYMV